MTALKFSTYSHLATYAHSIEVKNLLEIFTKYFFCHKPEMFVGILETKNAHQVIAKKDEIMSLVRKAGLCHDIGKIQYASTVALSSRRLYDFEFQLIQEHVLAGDMINTFDESIHCAKDAILGHYKWYDGSKGYPSNFNNRESRYAFIIDMVSVADSIDAATDTIGRR